MKKLKLNVNSKYIVLRDGYNKPLIIGSIIAIAFTIKKKAFWKWS